MSPTDAELRIRTPRGQELAATYSAATGHQRAPAVLLCQGLSGVRGLVLPTVAQRLSAAGIASLRFDYAGFGDSTGDRGWVRPADRIGDAAAAFAAMAGQSGVDPSRLGVYGHSYGGATAIGLAADELRVRAIVTVSAPGSGTSLLRSARPAWEWVDFCRRVEAEMAAVASGAQPTLVPVEDILPFSPAFEAAYARLKAEQGGSSALSAGPGKTHFFLATVADMLRSHPESDAMRLSHCPLLMINGAMDDTVPLDIVEPVFRAAPGPKRWRIVSSADHNALDTPVELNKALDDVLAWFQSYL